MLDYSILKLVHQTCVALTFVSFSLRGIWMIRNSPYLQNRATKILPHLIDSALLLSAILLVIISEQYPTNNSWVAAKIVALVVYIACGTFALKRGKTRKQRMAFFVLALASFAYIALVAVTKNPFLIA